MNSIQQFLSNPKVDSFIQIAIAISAYLLPDNIEHVITAGMALLGIKNGLIIQPSSPATA